MRILLAALALMVATNAAPVFAKGAAKTAKKAASPAADPNAVVAKAHGGKLWILAATVARLGGRGALEVAVESSVGNRGQPRSRTRNAGPSATSPCSSRCRPRAR